MNKKLDIKILTFVMYEKDSLSLLFNYYKNRLSNFIPEIKIRFFSELSQINNETFSFFEEEKNHVFLLSNNKAFLSQSITFCSQLGDSVIVFSDELVKDIPSLDIEKLMKLNVQIPVSNYFNNADFENVKLLNKFENKFKHAMNDKSVLSFKSILHFSNIKQFKFIQISENSGYINTNIQMCTFKGYQLLPIE